MNFGTIGAGTVARAIAGHLVTAGHKVTLSNSRGPDTLLDVVTRLGPLASAGTAEEAAAADMVFLAVMWPQVGDALAGLPELDGRILVDTTSEDGARPRRERPDHRKDRDPGNRLKSVTPSAPPSHRVAVLAATSMAAVENHPQ